MSIEEDFFKNLSERLYKENSLSDITWALCESSDWFRDFFLKYCFEEEITNINCLEREYSSYDSRLDFYITTKDEKEYLIEVKKGDKKNHFRQYNKTFPKTKKSLIANYKVPAENGWTTKTWREFSQLLSDNISEINSLEKNIIKGYISYLNSVINKVEVKQMNFTNITSLSDFYNCLTEICEKITVVSLKENNNKSNSAIKSDRYGKYFYYSNSKNKSVCFWIGLYFCTEYFGIYFWIDHTKKNECPKNEACIMKELKSGTYFDKINIDGDGLWVGLKEEYQEKFCSDTNVEEQKQILYSFLNEILQRLV
jgi:phage anti-repressor protein